MEGDLSADDTTLFADIDTLTISSAAEDKDSVTVATDTSDGEKTPPNCRFVSASPTLCGG